MYEVCSSLARSVLSNRGDLEARFEAASQKTILEVLVQYNLGVLVGYEVVQVHSHLYSVT